MNQEMRKLIRELETYVKFYSDIATNGVVRCMLHHIKDNRDLEAVMPGMFTIERQPRGMTRWTPDMDEDDDQPTNIRDPDEAA